MGILNLKIKMCVYVFASIKNINEFSHYSATTKYHKL